MQVISSALATLLFVNFVAADTLSFFGNQQALRQEDLAVPGDNPLTYCRDADRNDDILTIDYVDLNPNPPVPYVFYIPSSVSI